MMRRTEAAILSSKASACDLFATVTLKGHKYLTCSFLAARYHAGEGIFLLSWVILLGSIFALRMHNR